MRIFRGRDLVWKGNKLYLRTGGKPLVEIVPDAVYSGMWRVHRHDGSLTDIVNKTRARDAARVLALAELNAERRDLAA